MKTDKLAQGIACAMALLICAMLGTTPVMAEIRYITEEEAEEVRLCLLYRNKAEQTEKDLREATVAGGSAAGTVMEANAKRTKLRFQRDYYQQKVAEACADEEPDHAASDDSRPGEPVN